MCRVLHTMVVSPSLPAFCGAINSISFGLPFCILVHMGEATRPMLYFVSDDTDA